MSQENCKMKIKMDLCRYAGKVDLLTFLKMIFSNRVFRFLTIFRIQESKQYKLIAKVLWKVNSTKRMMQLTPGTKIGGDCPKTRLVRHF